MPRAVRKNRGAVTAQGGGQHLLKAQPGAGDNTVGSFGVGGLLRKAGPSTPAALSSPGPALLVRAAGASKPTKPPERQLRQRAAALILERAKEIPAGSDYWGKGAKRLSAA